MGSGPQRGEEELFLDLELVRAPEEVGQLLVEDRAITISCAGDLLADGGLGHAELPAHLGVRQIALLVEEEGAERLERADLASRPELLLEPFHHPFKKSNRKPPVEFPVGCVTWMGRINDGFVVALSIEDFVGLAASALGRTPPIPLIAQEVLELRDQPRP